MSPDCKGLAGQLLGHHFVEFKIEKELKCKIATNMHLSVDDLIKFSQHMLYDNIEVRCRRCGIKINKDINET